MLAILIALQLADIYTTHHILKRGGRELNPVLAKLFTMADPLFVMVVVKSGMMALLYFYPLPTILMFLIIVFYSWVVWSNWRVLKNMEKNG